jgi:hypothetical protein
MAQYSFGAGQLWGIPTSDAFGNAIAATVASPVLFGVLQEVSVEIDFDNKMLFGQNQFPVAVGRGKGKVGAKAKMAQLNGSLINSLFFGQTMTSGIYSTVYDTTGSVIPTTPFQTTPVVPSSGTWAVDLGVRDSNGIPLVRVASAPATGQYSVTAGVYTFNIAQQGNTVFISFQYTATSTSAKRSTVQNVPMGYAPTFRADLTTIYQGRNFTLTFPTCIASKLSFATKLDDFNVPDFDFDVFADASGNVMTWATTEN